jgi:hypothetical protein
MMTYKRLSQQCSGLKYRIADHVGIPGVVLLLPSAFFQVTVSIPDIVPASNQSVS